MLPAGMEKFFVLRFTKMFPPDPPPLGHVKGTVTEAVTVYVVAPWWPSINLKLYPPETQSPGRIWRAPSMLEGPMPNVLP